MHYRPYVTDESLRRSVVPTPDPAIRASDDDRDLVARILVETPTRMNARQKKLLEEFRATETGDECPASKSFFARARDYFGG